MSEVLRTLHKQWSALIGEAKKDKWERFGAQAAEANQFYQTEDPHFMYDANSPFQSGLRVNNTAIAEDATGNTTLTFEAYANLVANVVSVFLPVLYHKNPTRVVRPRVPAVPASIIASYRQAVINEKMQQLEQQVQMNPALMADPVLQQQVMMLQQQAMSAQMMAETRAAMPSKKELEDKLRATLIEAYQNYTPNETDLMQESRDAITEGLVKGMGLLWTVVDNEGPQAIIRSEYDSVDHLLMDPDCENIRDAKWIARRRKRPVWEVERELGYEPGTLKGTDKSTTSEAEESTMDEFDREFEAAEGKSNDLIVYWEVFSRMGVGARLPSLADDTDEKVLAKLESFGDYAYLMISPSSEVPLNLPEHVVDADETGDQTAAMLEWPIPFYKNRENPWPFAPISFRKKSRCPWPMSYVQPAMGYLKCINWILSFLMARIKIVSRAFIVMPEGLEDSVYNAVMNGADLTLLKIKSAHPQEYQKFCDFLKMPEENGNIWKLLEALKREFEDATGVTELNMSARTTQQMRSAAEADLKRDVLNVRPEDMANKVDEWMGKVAKLEAIAARYILKAEDVAPVFGESQPAEVDMGLEENPMQYGEMTQLWVELVQSDDVDRISCEYEYTIESGSARKPNKTQQVQNIDEGGAAVVPLFTQIWQQTGDPSKFNAFIEAWAKTRDMTDWEILTLPDMRGMMMPPPGGPPPQEGQPPEGPPGGGDSSGEQPPPEAPPPGGPPV